MRAAVYDPYLDTGGGGERYMMTAACVLAKNGYKVDVYWPTPKIKDWLETRLGLDLSKISFVDNLARGAGCDIVFWLSDGSLPILLGKKNFIHFQTPFTKVEGKSLVNRLKRVSIKDFICNSEFTKKVIDREFGIKSKVVYPPVDTHLFKNGKKENIILFVGRFSQLQQLKRQDVLVETFQKMCDAGFKGWKLALVGGSDVGGKEYVRELKASIGRYPIDILENLPLDEVVKYYSKAKIFWSAVGYGANPEKEPHKVEHFGMSVVEGMSAGCVPIVIEKGGHTETIKNGENGFLWNSVAELQELTQKIASDERRRKHIAGKAEKDSQKFSIEAFERNISKVFK